MTADEVADNGCQILGHTHHFLHKTDIQQKKTTDS